MKKLLMLSLALLCTAGLTSTMFAVKYDPTYAYKKYNKPYKQYAQQIQASPMMEGYKEMEPMEPMDNRMDEMDEMDDAMQMDVMTTAEEN